MITQKDVWHAPLGFWTSFLAAKLDIAFHAHTNMLSGISLTFWATVCFAVTGWVSGLIGAFIYDLGSRVFGLQLQRQSEAESNRAAPD
jgi:hypothetical protein